MVVVTDNCISKLSMLRKFKEREKFIISYSNNNNIKCKFSKEAFTYNKNKQTFQKIKG